MVSTLFTPTSFCFLVWRRPETGDRCKMGNGSRVTAACLSPPFRSSQTAYCYTYGLLCARRDITVSRNSLARCTARHLRLRHLVQCILVGAVSHPALTSCAARLCRALRRLSGLRSSNVSDTANMLRKTRKKKSSAVPLFRSGHMSAICARLRNKGKRELRG